MEAASFHPDDERYVPRNEIAAYFRMLHQEIASVKQSQEAHHDTTLKHLERIEKQTTETNGRVRDLEGWRQRIEASYAPIRVVFLGACTALGGASLAWLAHLLELGGF